jgi:hypothetical protein
VVAAGVYDDKATIAELSKMSSGKQTPLLSRTPRPARKERDSHFSHSPDCCWYFYEPNN